MRFGGFFIPMPVVVEWALPQPELRPVREKLLRPVPVPILIPIPAGACSSSSLESPLDSPLDSPVVSPVDRNADNKVPGTGTLFICTNKHALNYACGTTLLRRLKSEYTKARAGFGAIVTIHAQHSQNQHQHQHQHQYHGSLDAITTSSGDAPPSTRYADTDGLFIVTHSARFSERRFAALGRDPARLRPFTMTERDEAIARLIEREFNACGFKPVFSTAYVPDGVGRAW